jgi:hypothetical protein
VRLKGLGRRQGINAAVDSLNLIPALAEQERKNVRRISIVINDKHPQELFRRLHFALAPDIHGL